MACHDQRPVHLRHRLADERRRVEVDAVLQARGKILAHLAYRPVDPVRHLDGVCLGKGEYDDLGGLVATARAVEGVGLLPELHPPHVAYAHDLGARPRRVALHDDVFELVGIGKPAEAVDGVLEDLPLGNRRAAQLARRHLHVLVRHRGEHIGGCEVKLFEPVRVEPEAHAVLTGAENPDQADTGQTGQGVLHVDLTVIREK